VLIGIAILQSVSERQIDEKGEADSARKIGCHGNSLNRWEKDQINNLRSDIYHLAKTL